MKTIISFSKSWSILCVILLGGILIAEAQTPGIPYQAYIEDTNSGYIPGEQLVIPLSNADILLQFEIRNSKGDVEYIEQIPAKTDEYGLINTVIGVGVDGSTPVLGDFSDIVWDGLPKEMFVDVDFSNTGSQFEDLSNIDLVYIPSPGGNLEQTTTYLVDNNDGSFSYHNEESAVTTFSVPQHGVGDPNTLGTLGSKGDLFVDESSNNLFVHGGSAWLPINAESTGVYTGVGDPVTANPTTGEAGDIYVDESTGDIYTYDGANWSLVEGVDNQTAAEVNVADGTVDIDGDGNNDTGVTVQDVVENIDTVVASHETLTSLSVTTNNGPDGTAGTADDFDELTYTDEDGVANVVPLSGLVTAAETLTSLSVTTNNGPDGTAGTADDFDELTYTDEDGVANVVPLSSLVAAEEPWFGTDDNAGATTNTEDIYHMGNVGVGIAPTEALHVAGNIRMVDGTQGAGKVLTSDATGVATWQALPSGTVDTDNQTIETFNVNTANNTLELALEDDGEPIQTVSLSDLAREPWQIQGTTNPATANTDNIVQNGNVSVGTINDRKSFQFTGALFAGKVRETATTTGITWADDDFCVVVTAATPIALPAATLEQTGRVVSIRNNSTTARQFIDYATNIDKVPENFPDIRPGVGVLFICTGTSWHVLSGR